MLYLCLKSSSELATEASNVANNLLDLITLRESVVGSKYAVSVLGALKPRVPDLLIVVSSSTNVLCIDGSLDGVKSKQGFDDLAIDGDIEDYLGSKKKGRRKKSRDYLEKNMISKKCGEEKLKLLSGPC